jgi:predicted membrane channel-forming protein YqfA (hemolysin III family)
LGEKMMDDKKKKSLPISSMLYLFAGVLFVLAAFPIITNDVGIDYVSMFIGIVFLVLGIMGIINRK